MRLPWLERAFCFKYRVNPEVFEDPGNVETALAYCQRCLVRVECLDYALALRPHVEGVWGGTTDDDRARLRRGGHRATCPGCLGVSVYSDGVTEICIACGLTWRI